LRSDIESLLLSSTRLSSFSKLKQRASEGEGVADAFDALALARQAREHEPKKSQPEILPLLSNPTSDLPAVGHRVRQFMGPPSPYSAAADHTS